MKRVDARGLSCPEPVIQTKNAMASKEAEYEVLVDNVVAKENVSRFVMHQGYQVNVEEQGDDFLLKKMHLEALVMPVPRDLSSSCGTCVRFVAEGEFPEKNEEVEQIVRIEDSGYVCIYHADGE